MQTKTNDLKLGLFVLVGAGLLLAGVVGFGALAFFQRSTVMETYLTDNADGLVTGAPVTLRGVKVGQVTGLDFSWNVYDKPEPGYVVVQFTVRDNVAPSFSGEVVMKRVNTEVEKGLRARVKSQGFTGSSFLSLEYVDPEEYPRPVVPWTPRHPFIPSTPSQVSELLGNLQKTLRNAADVDFADLGAKAERDLDHADRLMGRVACSLNHAEGLMGHLEDVNYHGLATNADALITGLRSDLQQMRLAKLSSDADETMVGLNDTIGRLKIVVANLDAGSINDALGNLRRASKDLDDTMRKLQRYPAGFLFGKPPAPVASVQKDSQ